VARARAAGAQLCININGSPFERAKSGERERTVAERARETSMPIAYVNQVCGQDELVFDGGSVVVDSAGGVIARAAHFVEELLVVDVPITERVVAQKYDCPYDCRYGSCRQHALGQIVTGRRTHRRGSR
jgi:NAD+ synthase (glutamine-hydrolysing)